MQKVKAFTIIELVVTLVISSIVVAAAFVFYLGFTRLQQHKNEEMDHSNETLRFYEILRTDFTGAVRINPSSGSFALEIQGRGSVIYEQDSSFVLRIQGPAMDTFRITTAGWQFSADPCTGWIKTLYFEMNTNKQTYPVLLTKRYSNDRIFNHFFMLTN